jgi:transaldolase
VRPRHADAGSSDDAARGVIFFSAAVKLFVDSADPAEIALYVAAKATCGATTSASLLAEAARRTGRQPGALLGAICAVANGPVGVAVTAADRGAMLRDARAWAAVAANVVAVLPASDDGVEVVRACAAERIGTGVAAGASPELVLVAARAGAALVTVPVGRVGGVDGYDMVRKLIALFRTYEVATQVIAAAICIPTELIDAAVVGAHAATAPGDVLRQLDAESTRRADGRV